MGQPLMACVACGLDPPPMRKAWPCCQRCKENDLPATYYCSDECQTEHWNMHRSWHKEQKEKWSTMDMHSRKLDDEQEAVKAAEEAQRSGAECDHSYAQMTRSVSVGNYRRAARMCLEQMRDAPTDPRTPHTLAVIYLRMGRYAEAASASQQASNACDSGTGPRTVADLTFMTSERCQREVKGMPGAPHTMGQEVDGRRVEYDKAAMQTGAAPDDADAERARERGSGTLTTTNPMAIGAMAEEMRQLAKTDLPQSGGERRSFPTGRASTQESNRSGNGPAPSVLVAATASGKSASAGRGRRGRAACDAATAAAAAARVPIATTARGGGGVCRRGGDRHGPRRAQRGARDHAGLRRGARHFYAWLGFDERRLRRPMSSFGNQPAAGATREEGGSSAAAPTAGMRRMQVRGLAEHVSPARLLESFPEAAHVEAVYEAKAGGRLNVELFVPSGVPLAKRRCAVLGCELQTVVAPMRLQGEVRRVTWSAPSKKADAARLDI